MKKRVINFNSKKISLPLMCFFVFVVGVSIVSATYGYACVNCAPNQVLTSTKKCGNFNEKSGGFEIGENSCLNGKSFQAGAYSWEIKKDNEKILSGIQMVDKTGKFCLNTPTDESGEYEINFGGLVKSYYVKPNEVIIPEFNTVIGILTFIGAMGVFFIVRGK